MVCTGGPWASLVANHEHQVNDGSGFVSLGWRKLDFRAAGAIRVDGVSSTFPIVETVLVSVTTHRLAVRHHPIHLGEVTLAVELSHGHSIALLVAIREHHPPADREGIGALYAGVGTLRPGHAGQYQHQSC